MDLGMLSGIASGLNQGVQNFYSARDQQQKYQQQKQANQLTMQQAGYTTDENGNIIPGDVKSAQIAEEKSLLDPTSPSSQAEVIRQKRAILFSNPSKKPEDVDALFPEGTTGLQAREYGKQFITGGYGIQGKEAGLTLRDEQMNKRLSQQAQQAVNKDHLLSTYSQRVMGAGKILDLIHGAEGGDYKSNQALLGQLNAEIGRLETGAQNPGLNASEKTEMTDSAAKLHNVLDTLTGNVTGVDLSKKYEQAKGMIQNLGNSYYDAINDRYDQLGAGALPEQMSTFDAKKSQFQHSKYGQSFASPQQQQKAQGLLGGPSAQNQGLLPQTKTVNGIEYIKVPGGWAPNVKTAGQ